MSSRPATPTNTIESSHSGVDSVEPSGKYLVDPSETDSVGNATQSAPGVQGSEPIVRALVITCSDSVSQGRAKDGSGPLVIESLAQLGFNAKGAVVPDERDQIAAAIRIAVADGVRVVVATGGTGLGPRDVTPEALAAVCEREIPGFGEAFRVASRDRVPLTDLSRAAAGTLGDALIVALPGSVGGASDGMAVIGPLIQHALDMMSGGGHSHGHGGSGPAHGHEVAHSGQVTMATVTDEPIDPGHLSDAVADDTAGAVVDFAGRVRDHDDGRDVVALTYEAHPDAQILLAQVLAEGSHLPGVVKVAAAHRVGDLQIGDLAFAVAVSAPHRSEAFAAASWLVDEIKDRLPVWKLQTFAGGEKEWVDCA